MFTHTNILVDPNAGETVSGATQDHASKSERSHTPAFGSVGVDALLEGQSVVRSSLGKVVSRLNLIFCGYLSI